MITSLPGSPPFWAEKLQSAEYVSVCLWLKFSPSLTLNKIEHFSMASMFYEKNPLKLNAGSCEHYKADPLKSVKIFIECYCQFSPSFSSRF